MNLHKTLFVIALFAALEGCASSPQLYPNAKYNQVGKETAQKDIQDCSQKADQSVGGGEVAKNTGVGAAIGAAGGAALGAITGSPGTGAATGAVVGGGIGAGSTVTSTSEVKHRFINRCLSERGYEVLGWS